MKIKTILKINIILYPEKNNLNIDKHHNWKYNRNYKF